MKRVKKFGVILALIKTEESSEKVVVFVHSAVFERVNSTVNLSLLLIWRILISFADF